MLCGTFASAELYTPAVLVPAPQLLSLSGNGAGQGAVVRAGTLQITSRATLVGEVANSANPTSAGEVLEILCRGIGGVSDRSSRILPTITIGGRRAEILLVDNLPGSRGVNRVTVRVPSGVAPESAVGVRLIYLDRASNEVTIAIR